MAWYDVVIGYVVVLVTVLVPFAIAMHKFGQIGSNMKTLQRDFDNFRNDINGFRNEVSNLRERVNTHINVINILKDMGLLKEGEGTKQ